MAEGMLAQASFQVEHYKISGSQSYLHIKITFISPSIVFFPYYLSLSNTLGNSLMIPLIVHFYSFPPKLNYRPQFSAFAMNFASPHNRSEAFPPTSCP